GRGRVGDDELRAGHHDQLVDDQLHSQLPQQLELVQHQHQLQPHDIVDHRLVQHHVLNLELDLNLEHDVHRSRAHSAASLRARQDAADLDAQRRAQGDQAWLAPEAQAEVEVEVQVQDQDDLTGEQAADRQGRA